jgi:dolichol kinase
MPFNGIVLAYYGVIAFVATVAEALSPKGIDNLTIPASVMLVLFLTQWY